MATTPNYSWVMPDPTDLVTDLPADFEIFGDAVDASVFEVETQVELNNQTGTTYTLVSADRGKLVSLSNASAITLTIPTNATTAFPTGTRIDIIQTGAGQVTVGGAGVTINSKLSNKKLTGQGSAASLIKFATDTWWLVGDLSA
jgi:hypothetical protein